MAETKDQTHTNNPEQHRVDPHAAEQNQVKDAKAQANQAPLQRTQAALASTPLPSEVSNARARKKWLGLTDEEEFEVLSTDSAYVPAADGQGVLVAQVGPGLPEAAAQSAGGAGGAAGGASGAATGAAGSAAGSAAGTAASTAAGSAAAAGTVAAAAVGAVAAPLTTMLAVAAGGVAAAGALANKSDADTSAPQTPVLALGTGVSGGATSAEATAAGGVVTVVAESGASTVVTFSNGSNTVSKTVTGNGSTPVAVTLSSADLTTLGNGTINVSAVATDAAGNASSAGASSFTLDTAVPSSPTLPLGTGVANGATTAEATANTGVVTVVAESGASTVVTFSNGNNTVSKTVTGNGSTPVAVTLTSADLTTLGDGTINVSAVATDAAGNASTAGTSSFTLDSSALAAPTLALGTGVSGGATSAEATAAGGVVTVVAESGASTVVTFSNGSNTVSKTVTGNGSTPVAVTLTSADLTTLGDGTINVSAVATDAAGNASSAGTSSFTLDTTIATPVLALGTGVSGGATSAEATAAGGVVTVVAESGASTVVTFSNGSNTVSKTVTGNGSTPVAVTLTSNDLTTLGDGTINVSATATDAAGNASSAGTTSFTLDIAAPSAPTLALGTGVSDGANIAEATAEGGVVTVVAESDASTVVTFTNGNNTVSKTVTGNGSTPFAVVLTSSDLTTLGDGTINVSAAATDAAGNASAAGTSSFSIDALAPAAPTLALGTGVSNGATSAEATAAGGVVTVVAESGASTVVTFTNGSNTVSKTVTGNGNTPVAVTLTSADLSTLGDGTISVSATATDAAGNASSAGTSSFSLDTAIATPVFALGTGVAGGASATEAMASTGVVTLMAEAGATVSVTLTNGSATVTKTVTGNGSTAVPVTLSLTDLVTLGNGTVSVSATAIDAAGNTSASASTSFTLNTAIELADVAAGAGGFVINGQSATDYSGIQIASVGDVNGDGLHDLLIGAYLSDPAAGDGAGRSYVVFGRTASTLVDLSAVAAGVGGFVINGESTTDRLGRGVASAGDINGDGLADLLVAAHQSDFVVNGVTQTNAGRSYVIFGKTDTTAVDASAIAAGSGGFVINGQCLGDNIGNIGLALAGDVNGDGLSDLLVGAYAGDPVQGGVAQSNAGRSYVVFGKTGAAAIDLSTIAAGTGGFVLNGQCNGDYSGQVLSSAGDVNGDGLIDLIVGASLADPVAGADAGRAYVVFGKTGSSAIDLSAVAAGSGGFVVNGQGAGDNLANSVFAAGDVNGDGLADVVIGAAFSDPSAGIDAGRTYVVFGKTGTAAVDASAVAAGSGGFVINGQCTGDWLGYVANAGDFNGDGLTDLIVGARYGDPASAIDAGRTYVVFGKTGTAPIDASAISAGSGGFVINGQSAGDSSGYRVTSAGDVNGDGYGDLLVGAWYSDPVVGGTTLTDAGRSYVIFGGPQFSSGAVALASGTSANELVVGTSGADTLTGGGGVDNFSAGAGNDTVVLSASDVTNLASNTLANVKANVDGGSGYDTLRLSGGANLDLSAISNVGAMTGVAGWSLSRINSIERIDLATDTAANTLTLTGGDVNDMAGMNLIHSGSASADGKTWQAGTYALPASVPMHQLVVEGTANDVLSMGGLWTLLGDVSHDGDTYNVYQSVATQSQVFVKAGVGVYSVPLLALGAGVDNGATSAEATAAGGVVTATLQNGVSAVVTFSNGANTVSKNIVGNGAAQAVMLDNADLSTLGDGTISVSSAVTHAGTVLSGTGARSFVLDTIADLPVLALGTGVSDGATTAEAMATGVVTVLAESGTSTVTFTNNIGNTVSKTVSTNGSTPVPVVLSFADVATLGHGTVSVSATVTDVVGNTSGAATTSFKMDISVLLDDIGVSRGGLVINGEAAGDNSGYSIAAAGDVNGDGLGDLIVSAPQAGGAAGRSYVVFGTSGNAVINLSSVAAGTGGFAINGQSANDNSGISVSGVGDFNGDGLADLIVGAPNADVGAAADAGRSYIVFGKTEATAVELSNLGTGGFSLNGQSASDYSGFSVSAAGDVNGDGLADVIVGAYGNNTSGTDAGRSYVVFGTTGNGVINLSNVAAGTGGFALNGQAASDFSGYSVSAAGDVNGDGYADLIVGAPLGDTGGGSNNRLDAGRTYVVFGKTGGTISLGDLQQAPALTTGFLLSGITNSDNSGWSVSAAGDVNGDGLADVIVGVPKADVGTTTDAGCSYVVLGRTQLAQNYLNSNNITSFAINGLVANEQSGAVVSSAGDVNGDGLSDLIIGTANSGRAWVVYGTTATTAIDLSAVTLGSGGFMVQGASSDGTGLRVSAAGDINGDGYADLLVGAPLADPSVGTDAGRSYVIYGGSAMASNVAGTAGTVGNDLVLGTAGNDTLTGGGGVDRFEGRAGNDTIVLTSSDVTNLLDSTAGTTSRSFADGGAGFDTLRLSGGAAFDLTQIRNAAGMAGATAEASSRINSIERMDLATDTAANALSLSATDVNDMAGMNLIRTGSVSADGNTWTNLQGTPLGTTTAYHQLVVDGTASDSLVLNSVVTKPDVWTQSGQVSDGTSTYDVYQHEATRSKVFVKSGVQVRTDPDTYLALIENGVGGRVINGVQYVGLSGYSVSNAGDVNGDGLDDVIIGNNNPSGRVFVVFGQPGNSRIDLSAVANATGGFEIKQNTSNAYTGFSVSGAGDVNGDGLADVLVGAYQEGASQNGRSYVVYGKTSTTAVQLSNLGTDGYSINGQGATDYLGYSVSAAGDVNGDGFADLLIGAYTNDAAATDAGRAYVLYGKPGGGTSMTLGATVASTDGFVINGLSSNSNAGKAVSNAGDVNGDGYADLLVSASGPNSYVLFGKSAAATINLWNQTNTSADGFVISGANSSISNAGDVNGDGLSDLILGNTATNTAYVVFGKTGNQAVAVTDLASGSAGFVINGQCTGDLTGMVSYAGDINGDGLADLLVGAPQGDPGPFGNAGRTYVVYGKTGYGAVDLSAVDAGNGGFVINGKGASANSGWSVSYAGDMNGDGFDDLLIGAHNAASITGNTQAGMTYIVYGGTQFAAGQSTVALATGTSADELVVGTSSADTLTGGGGLDRFSSGDGNDAITLTASDVSNLANLTVGGAKAYVDGGGDFDTLRLSGGSSLDLAAIRNQAAGAMDGSSRINSIERIDLATDTAANTLTLAGGDVNDMAGMNLIHTGSVSADGNTWVAGTYALPASVPMHQLVVDGMGSDVVNLKGAAAAWANAGTVSDGTSQYTVYQNASTNSKVIVKSGVTVNLNVAPVVLDLSGDGVLQYGQTLMDVNSDGVTDLTAWAGPQDGVLVHDANGDGRVNGATEFAFARHEGESDLQGLAAVFDSHQDGVLDMLDAQFAEFAVWQDANGNGVSDAGELHSLSALGIASIQLVSDGVQRTPATGVSEAGRTSAQLLNGSQMLVSDAAFTFAAAPAQPDAAAKVMALFDGAAPATAQASGPCCPVSSHDPADLLLQQALLLQTH